MENISSLLTYNTDTFNSWGIGNITIDCDYPFETVLKFAIDKKAHLIVKPSRGKYWYIKGINNKKTYQEIKSHIESNLISEYKPKSKSWLIQYS